MAFINGLADPDLRCEILERITGDDVTFASITKAISRAKVTLEARKVADETL